MLSSVSHPPHHHRLSSYFLSQSQFTFFSKTLISYIFFIRHCSIICPFLLTKTFRIPHLHALKFSVTYILSTSHLFHDLISTALILKFSCHPICVSFLIRFILSPFFTSANEVRKILCFHPCLSVC